MPSTLRLPTPLSPLPHPRNLLASAVTDVTRASIIERALHLLLPQLRRTLRRLLVPRRIINPRIRPRIRPQPRSRARERTGKPSPFGAQARCKPFRQQARDDGLRAEERGADDSCIDFDHIPVCGGGDVPCSKRIASVKDELSCGFRLGETHRRRRFEGRRGNNSG